MTIDTEETKEGNRKEMKYEMDLEGKNLDFFFNGENLVKSHTWKHKEWTGNMSGAVSRAVCLTRLSVGQ